MHDFTAKLRQPSAFPFVRRYLEWRRALAQGGVLAQGGASSAAATEAGEPHASEAAPPLPVVPLSLNLDLTTACNYACDHCIDWEALNLAVHHDQDALEASLRRLADQGLQSVILLGGGEPTLHPHFTRTVHLLKDLGLQLAVVTNGSRNEVITEVADRFEDGDWVRLSLDAGSDPTFQSMHHPKGRGIDLDSICCSARGIKRRNPAVQLGYSFVITWQGSERAGGAAVVENLPEMEAATLLAKQHGFDYISFKPFLTRAESGAEVLGAEVGRQEEDRAGEEAVALRRRLREGLAASKRHETEFFKVVDSINLRVFLADRADEFMRQPEVCHMQALRQVVSPLGVFNCPAHRGVEAGRIGDAKAWSPDGGGAEAGTAALLDGFDASRRCAEVTCLYNPVNRFLESCIRSDRPLDELLIQGEDCGDCFL